MPVLKVVNMAGKETGEITLSDAVFGAEVNAPVLHAAVKMYLANQRQGTQSALTRTEVSGGGKKPWRQKGTGHARQGSTRAPQWTHGGVVFAPKPRTYRLAMNKKQKQIALFSAMSDKVNGGNMIVVNEIKPEGYKTKVMADMLKAIGAGRKALVVLADNNAEAVKSFANIPGVKTAQYNTINAYDIVNADTFVVAEGAAKKIEEVYA